MDDGEKLGTLKRVPLRNIWGNETVDFTPWLAEKKNIRLLGETLGIDIEVIEQERYVGQYRADIYAKEVNTGKYVLIENQLEITDHSHLGQIITYASGLDTGIIIWISPKFTEEHRAAIDWLNRITNDNINFFAVEIELWKIDNSLPAPKFNIVCSPNDWTKTIQDEIRSLQFSSDKKLYFEYWIAFKKFVESSESTIRCDKPSPGDQMNLLMGNGPFRISANIEPANNVIKALLFVSDKSAASKRTALFTLLQEKFGSQLLELFGQDLIWNLQPEKKWDAVYVEAIFDPKDQNSWAQQHTWFKEQLEKMVTFFNTNLKDLQIDEIDTGGLCLKIQ